MRCLSLIFWGGDSGSPPLGRRPASPDLRANAIYARLRWRLVRSQPTEKDPKPIIPGKRGRKRKIRHDKRRYRERWRIEATFNRLKDFRRIATRYDKLARNYVSAVALVAVIAFWC